MSGSTTAGLVRKLTAVAGNSNTHAAGDSSCEWMDDLLSRRLIFVMGKGGVGKTTVSIALAGVAEKMKKKVLLVELGDTDSIGRIYQGRALSETPRRLTSHIWGARVDSRAELEAYVRTHIGPKFIASKIVNSRLFEYLFEATPGLKEVMSLGRLWRWERGNLQIPEKSIDLILVDAPATGHAMSLLHLPDVLINMIRVGPLANQIRKLQRLLKNDRKTGLVLVSLPEELPVNEAMEFYAMAETMLKIPVAATFINCVYPPIFSPAELKQLKKIETSYQDRPISPETLLIASAKRLIRRRSAQQNHIADIRKKAGEKVIELPFYFTNNLTLSEIQTLSSLVKPGPPDPKGPVS